MSKIIEKYNELKEKNNNKMYMFKSGKFYIFIKDDCDRINEYVVLKKTKFSNTYKCGFPDIALDDYLRVFKNHNLDIEIITDFTLDNGNIEDIIESIDINNTSPMEALNILIKLKRILDGKE